MGEVEPEGNLAPKHTTGFAAASAGDDLHNPHAISPGAV
jgi:hypothetical protein